MQILFKRLDVIVLAHAHKSLKERILLLEVLEDVVDVVRLLDQGSYHHGHRFLQL